MSTRAYLVHIDTGTKFEIVALDKAAGTITLRGKIAEFTEPYDKVRLKNLGYTMKTEEAT